METFSPYTFGAMSLGRDPADIARDLAVVRRAMEAGVWFHASPTYQRGFSYMVLRQAFDADRARVPRMVLKVRDANAALMRFEVEDSCRRLGIDGIDVAQLVSMDPLPGNLADQLRDNGGPLVEELASLRSRGLIRQAVLFLKRDNSDAAVEAARHELIDGVILYWNACQRDCSQSAWECIRERKIPTLALRTLGGGPKDKRSEAKFPELQKIMAAAGCHSATELALRLVASEEVVQTTIGGTASLAHLEAYLRAGTNLAPLPPEIVRRVEALQILSVSPQAVGNPAGQGK